MGPYIILICLILGAIGAWSIGGMLSKSDTSKKEPPQLSKFEQKMKASALKSREEALKAREELQQLREKLAREKAERERQKEEEKRRKKEKKQAKHK